jgi:hypothetical protein
VRGLDELRCAEQARLSADEPHRVEGGEDADQHDLADHARRHEPSQGHRSDVRDQVAVGEEQEEDQRERHHGLGELGGGGVHEAAEVAGHGADRQADQERHEHRADADLE